MELFGIALLLMASAFASDDDYVSYKGHKVIAATAENNYHIGLLHHLQNTENLDFWLHPRKYEPTQIRVAPEQYGPVLSHLTASGMSVRTVIDDLGPLIERQRQLVKSSRYAHSSIIGQYVDHSVINTYLRELARDHPDLVKVVKIGHSFENREILLLVIGNDKSRPNIFLDAGIHAREWIAPATCLYIIEQIIQGFNSGDYVVTSHNWHVLPSANPDGYQFSRDKERLWRKTRSIRPENECPGADPNRNFNVNFGGVGTSADSCTDIYPGTHPFSEPETAAIRDYIESDSWKAYVSLHSYSQMILVPWGFTSLKPSDNTEIRRVANLGILALQSVNGRSFTVGSPPELLYAASGGSFDWAKKVAGIRYSYTFELRPSRFSQNGFILDESEIIPSGKETWAACRAMVSGMKNN